MEAMDFERSSISWTLKGDDINGSWRIIATACRQDSTDCIYLAPAVMAGKIFGTDRLPIEPPFSYQLVATGDRGRIQPQRACKGNASSGVVPTDGKGLPERGRMRLCGAGAALPRVKPLPNCRPIAAIAPKRFLFGKVLSIRGRG